VSERPIPAHVLAEWDRKGRRCEQHNRARYWCGCAYKDGKP
jgi:hypothetical protein